MRVNGEIKVENAHNEILKRLFLPSVHIRLYTGIYRVPDTILTYVRVLELQRVFSHLFFPFVQWTDFCAGTTMHLWLAESSVTYDRCIGDIVEENSLWTTPALGHNEAFMLKILMSRGEEFGEKSLGFSFSFSSEHPHYIRNAEISPGGIHKW